MYLTSVQYTFNPLYASNFTFEIFNDSKGISAFNSSGTLKYDVTRGMAIGSIMGRSKDREDYDHLIFKGHVDSCNVKKGVLGNFVVMMLLPYLKKHSNLDIPCPQKKGFLYGTNFPFGDTSMLPRGILGFSDWMAEGSLKAKIDKKKPMVHLGSMKIYGSTE
jgi:hypothetical protein